MRCALFWATMLRVVAIPCQRFGTSCRSHLPGSRIQGIQEDAWPLKMGLTGCPETSATKPTYHYSQHNIPEGRTSHLLRGGSLKSRKGKKIFILVMYGSCLSCLLKCCSWRSSTWPRLLYRLMLATDGRIKWNIFLSLSSLSLSLSFRIGQKRRNYARPTLQRPLLQ